MIFFDLSTLIFSSCLADHVTHLHTMLETFAANKYFAKFSKCSFVESQVSYLGHMISKEGQQPDSEKVHAIQEWPLHLVHSRDH